MISTSCCVALAPAMEMARSPESAGEHEAQHHHRQGDEQGDDQAAEGEAEHLRGRLGAMLRRGKPPQ